MSEAYHLTAQDRDLIGRTIRRVEGMGRGQQPLPRRRRGIDGGAGGASTPINFRWGRITDFLSAATSNLTAGWGEGAVRLLNDDTGEEESGPFVCKNRYDFGVAEGTICRVSAHAGAYMYEYGTCRSNFPWE